MITCPEHAWSKITGCPDCARETRSVDHAAHAARVRAEIARAKDEATTRARAQQARYDANAAAQGES